MARMNQAEVEAEVARAHWEGAKEISALVASMTKLGLGLAAVSGALDAQVKELGAEAVTAKEKAEDSRAPKPEAAKQPSLE